MAGPTNLQGLNTYLALLQSGGMEQFPQQVQKQGAGLAAAPPGMPQGIDIASAFKTGENAALGINAPTEMPMPMQGFARGGRVRGYADGGEVSGGLGSLDDIDPMIIELARKQLAADEIDEDEDMGGISYAALLGGAPVTGDDTPTSEDKALALAQAGFGMAAGDSPHALQNIGAGALGGVQALQKAKQQRALLRMREAQAAQQAALRQAALMDAAKQKAAALKQAEAAAREKAEIAREKLDQDRRLAEEKAEDKRIRAEEAAAAAADRAAALEETRYNSAAGQRLRDYNATGQWRELAGDKERGITGPPADEAPYSGPVINDPTVPLKERNKLKVEKPAQEQALNTISMTLDKTIKDATELATHPGLAGAIGFRMGQEFVPGSDAASFKAKLQSLRDKQFRDALQAMRDASRTGGAVGNVSEKEGARFEGMIASLSAAQNEEEFKIALKDIIDYTRNLRGTYLDKFEKTYGDLPKMRGTSAETPGGAPAGVEGKSLLERLNKYPPRGQ